MTNAVVAAVVLLIQTNSSRELPHPDGVGMTTYFTNVTKEVVTYTNMGIAHTVTNSIETNITAVTVRKLIPEVPPVRNQPRKL